MNQWVTDYAAPLFCERLPDLEIESDEMRASWKSLIRPEVKWSKGVHGDGQSKDLNSTSSSGGRARYLSEDEDLFGPTRQTTLAYQRK